MKIEGRRLKPPLITRGLPSGFLSRWNYFLSLALPFGRESFIAISREFLFHEISQRMLDIINQYYSHSLELKIEKCRAYPLIPRGLQPNRIEK